MSKGYNGKSDVFTHSNLRMRLLKIIMSHFWCNIYLIIGVCIGISLSFLFTSIEISENEKIEPLPHLSNYPKDMNEYEPKINPESKPHKAQKIPKMLVRPRYYSTELGIREKLFVGVLTSLEYLHNRDIAFNKTVVHLVNKLRYFISIPEGVKPNISLPGIVGFTDTRSILKPFHVIKYIMDNYLEEYDYYFLVKDTSYINARKLVDFVNGLSTSQNIHLGIPSELEDYCSLDAGILLSNSVVQELKNNLDWCVKNTYSDQDDINLGRCILHSISLPCSSTVQGHEFLSTKLKPTFNFEKDLNQLISQQTFRNSLTIYPIYDQFTAYKFNMYFAAIESIEIQREILHLRREILATASLLPEAYRNFSWPVGNQIGNKASGRFDVLHWTYFNSTHSFHENNNKNVEILGGDAKFDIDRIINITASNLEHKYHGKLKFDKLLNGYKKFDASKGMLYTLDMVFDQSPIDKKIVKRIEVSKLLGKVEILSIPYVTENTRIHMILIVDSHNVQDALRFMEHYAQTCMEKKHKTFLMLVLVYESGLSSKGKGDIFYDIKRNALTLTEKYRKDQSKITWLSVRLPPTFMNLTGIKSTLQIAIADLCVKKFPLDTLILFVEPAIELRLDYLNRVRMNTIVEWQVYSPIPFIEFHPDIIYTDGTKQPQLDINRNYGRYDEFNYDNVAFYVKDYITMRKTVETGIPFAHTDSDISMLLSKLHSHSVRSLFGMFVLFSDLHAFRAVEPALKIRYKDIYCDNSFNHSYATCMKRKNLHLGRRGQLARLIVDYHNYKK